MYSRTLPSPILGEEESSATRWLLRDPCDISIGLSRIPLDNICVYSLRYSGYSRSVGARSCRSGRRETGTQIGLIGKTENHIGYQIRKPVCIFRENRKPNAKKRKIRKPQWTPKPKNRRFLEQKPKNRSKKIARTAKPKIPMPPSWREIPLVNQKLTFDERISCITRHDDFLPRSNRASYTFPQRLQRQKPLSRSSNRSNRTENEWVYNHLIQVNLK